MQQKSLITTKPIDFYWVVYIGKEKVYLAPEEYEVLKQAAERDDRLVFFEDMAVSIRHISLIKRKVNEKEKLEGNVKRKLNINEIRKEVDKII